MNQQMWAASATQDNVALLRRRGVSIFGPGEGEQACGEVGPGRMLEPPDIVDAVAGLFATGSLQGRTVLVTAGPTREAIDPVRFLSNHSSGKMGTEVATAAAEAGARVILVCGPTDQPVPSGAERIDVISAQEMLEAVLAHVVSSDIFVAAAAVADYRPRHVASSKIKKDESGLSLELEPCPDILSTVSRSARRPFCVGFAAETDALEVHARDKLHRKGLDMIAANWVGPAATATKGAFGSDTNALRVLWHGGHADLPPASKASLARQLVALIAQHYRVRQSQSREVGKVVNMAKHADTADDHKGSGD
jgi:phosphopantothenoylcysteine decarboxylase/phosphopantothenate--cysteine ligase